MLYDTDGITANVVWWWWCHVTHPISWCLVALVTWRDVYGVVVRRDVSGLTW